jgi:hypothetical protein
VLINGRTINAQPLVLDQLGGLIREVGKLGWKDCQGQGNARLGQRHGYQAGFEQQQGHCRCYSLI